MSSTEKRTERPGFDRAVEAAAREAHRLMCAEDCTGEPDQFMVGVAAAAVAAAYPVIARAVTEAIAAEWTDFRRIGTTRMCDLTGAESRIWDRHAAVVGDVLDAGEKLDVAAWVRFAGAAVGGAPE